MAGKMDKKNFIIQEKKGETLVKNPGDLDGKDFMMMLLEDCNVYIMDHTTQMQVDDCKNCNIFIGPCMGSVFFRDCSDCTVHVAAAQVRTRDVHNMKFAVYCPSSPSIETSTNCIFSCWRGAYPGLTAHFAASGMDPLNNTWKEIYDFNKDEDLGAPHWYFEEPAPLDWVEVKVEGSSAPCDNPVLRADGAAYAGAIPSGVQMQNNDLFGPPALVADEEEDAFAAAAQESAIPAGEGDEEFAVEEEQDEGPMAPHSSAVFAVTQEEGPTAQALKMIEVRERMEVEAREEAANREELRKKADTYLESYYKNRVMRITAVKTNHLETEKQLTVEQEATASTWEKMFSQIDLTDRSSRVKDVSRYQAVLFACKSKKLQVPSRPEWGA